MTRLRQALEFADNGFSVIPLAGKVPFMDDWPVLATTDQHQLRDWFASGKRNIGVVTGEKNNLLVADFDEKKAAREFYAKHRTILKTIVETRRGAHFAFRPAEPDWPGGKLYVDGQVAGDIKAQGGQVCWPNSSVPFDDENGAGVHHYRFVAGHGLVPADDLPVFDPAWFPKPLAAIRTITRGEVREAIRYVMRIQSIQGAEGSRGLVRAAAILRDSGMSEAEAMVVLIDWNKQSDRVVPEWSLPELARALKNTYMKGK